MSKVLFLVSPTLNSFADPRKGTTGNKIDCASKHFANGFVTHTVAGAAIAGAGLVGRSIVKKAAVSNPDTAKKLLETGPVKKAFKYLGAAPKWAKVAAAAVTGVMALIYSYRTGKIEQKYLDRAQFVDHTFNLDGEGSRTPAAQKIK